MSPGESDQRPSPGTAGGGMNPLSGNSSWQLLAPVVLFLGLNRVAGLRWAVVVATAWSIGTVIVRRRNGLPLGRFFPIVTAALLIRGALGAVTESEAVYFGLGIATKFAVSLALAASVGVGRSLASLGAPYVLDLPVSTTNDPSFRAAMRDVTLIGSVYYCISASFDLWLFQRSSTEGFVLGRLLANWPFTVAMLGLAFAAANRHLKHIDGLDPLPVLLERRLAQYTSEGDA